MRRTQSEKEPIQVIEHTAPDAVTANQTELATNVGLGQFIEAQKKGIALTPEVNRKIVIKLDAYVLSIMFFTSILQFLDKTALNYANLFGIRTDLGLSGSEYSWLASLFYLGYLIAQFPASYLFSKLPTGKLLGVCIILWGITILVFTWSSNFTGAAVCRFLLGVLEAPITPGITLAVGHWWTRDEAALRYNIIYSALGWAGIIGSLMSTGISTGGDNTLVKKWQLVFLVLGSITTVWGFVVFLLLPDSPVDAKFFTHEERLFATARVASNQVGIKSGEFKLYQVRSSLYDFKTWCIVISIFAAGIPNGVISNFSTELIRNLGFSTIKTTLMDCIGNAFQVFGLISGGYIASHIKNTRILVASVGNIACLIAAALLAYLPEDRTWMRLVAFWFTNLQSVSFALGLNMITVNMSGYTKKRLTSALTFISYCAGNVVGPQFVLQSQAPRFSTATKAMMIGFVGKTVCHAALGVFMLLVNKQRDDKLNETSGSVIDAEAERHEAETRGMMDQTEFENKAFRYVL
ncbi:MFS general substrate transporter [Pyrrhoderma noxium]|uniref:MFS general substrate transporter n=1 Tax=Pyrrhoderma noxium TaxID=2282107 RepID=A0A286UXL2_9AGAM|nr:MFS general substrate transporter [Pyrrhoderma noxium]